MKTSYNILEKDRIVIVIIHGSSKDIINLNIINNESDNVDIELHLNLNDIVHEVLTPMTLNYYNYNNNEHNEELSRYMVSLWNDKDNNIPLMSLIFPDFDTDDWNIIYSYNNDNKILKVSFKKEKKNV